MPPRHSHPAAIDPDELLRQCEIEFLRRSGPGGQHRNKVETGVRLVHLPTGVKAQACERRSQAANRRKALLRLRINLALEVRQPVDPEEDPSERRPAGSVGGPLHVSPSHDDFPALLAEVLDVLRAADGDVTPSTRHFSCTPSQLVRFLKKEPRALGLLNTWREAAGRHLLK